MYVNGKVDGKYTVWYPNGNVHYVGYYKNGQKTGKWIFYNESGKLTKENNY
jgi:antitoxin component YwqK of YwqJK toxin-antitoxin module